MKFFAISVVVFCLQVTSGISLLAVDNSAHALTASESAEPYRDFAPSFLEISKKVLSSAPVKADAGKGAQRMRSDDFPSVVVGVKKKTSFYGGSLGVPFSSQDAETTSSNPPEVLPSEKGKDALDRLK